MTDVMQREIVVGLGVQGYKRRLHAGSAYVASVDPVNAEAEYRRVEDVPLPSYDAALCCIPDEPKVEILEYLLAHGKHVLVEKPLWAARDDEIERLEKVARANGVVCYTAYNHRFEPHFVRARAAIKSGKLGKIYRCRMFYGNGTARIVRESAWRDQGAGVLPDLASHLIDTVVFWFGSLGEGFSVASANCFENRAPDHVVLIHEAGQPKIELEMTLLQWRNHFTCDILAEAGSLHISSLCKWGPSTFTRRGRVLPSGRPPEEAVTLVCDDPTWAAEHAHFRALCASRPQADLSHDLWLNRTLRCLGEAAIKSAHA
jgi:scyllo-inositol 2-dehydrogenase (NADP+)